MTSTFFFSSILFNVEENWDLFQIIILQNMPIWYISFYFLQFLLFLWNILVSHSIERQLHWTWKYLPVCFLLSNNLNIST